MSSPPTIEDLAASINTFIINQKAFQNHITDEFQSLHTLLKPQASLHPIHNNHLFADPIYASHKTFNQHCDFSNPPSTYTSSLTPYNITQFSTHPSPWSTYNPPPPSFCGFQHLTHQLQLPTPTALHHHHHQYLSHDPYFQPNSNNTSHHTYNNTTSPPSNWSSYKPLTQQPPATTYIDPLSLFVPLNSGPSPKGKDEIAQQHELVVDGNNSFTSFDSNSRVTMEEKKLVNTDDVGIVTEPTQFDVESSFTVSETDERSRDDVVSVKGQEDHRDVPPSISQSPCDSDGVESLTIQSIVDVPIDLVPTKHHSIFPTRPLLLPYHFTVLTSKDGNTLSKATKREVPNHMIFNNNFDPGGDECRVLAAILGNSVDVFDPGGNGFKFHSPARIGGNDRHTLSMMWLPWDRGKLCVSKFLFSIKYVFANCLFSSTSVAVSFPARGAASGWPWVPWNLMKMTASVNSHCCKTREGRGYTKGNLGIKVTKILLCFNGLNTRPKIMDFHS